MGRMEGEVSKIRSLDYGCCFWIDSYDSDVNYQPPTVAFHPDDHPYAVLGWMCDNLCPCELELLLGYSVPYGYQHSRQFGDSYVNDALGYLLLRYPGIPVRQNF